MYHNLIELLQKQIVYLDGAMGTMIQRYNLTESDFRGENIGFHDIEKGPTELEA